MGPKCTRTYDQESGPWSIEDVGDAGSDEGTDTDADRGRVTLPADYAASALTLAYASTAMAGQGRTVDHSLVLVDGPIDEAQTALRNLSREGRCDLYVRTLAYAWRWTVAMPWQDRAAVHGQLIATNALTDSTDAEREGVRLELP